MYLFYLYIDLVDENILLKYAIDYLSKYDSSQKNLIYVLKRKIFKLKVELKDKNKLLNSIDKIIAKLQQNNFLDDNRYCVSKIMFLSRAGKSKSYIINYLLKKGLSKSIIEINLNQFSSDNNDWELDSAYLFAKKKRLLKSNESYEKKLARLSRAGFSYAICKKILG